MSTAPTHPLLWQCARTLTEMMQQDGDSLLPFRCHRFKRAKGRYDSIATALEAEYDQCFWNEMQKYSRIFTACKPLVISVAMCTAMPLMHEAVSAALDDTHVVVDAVAYRFCIYLGQTWFGIDNDVLAGVAFKLISLRKLKMERWYREAAMRAA